MIAEHGAHRPVLLERRHHRPASALDDPDDLWHAAFEVNVMAHVYAARAVVPAHARARRGLPAQHRVGGRAADLARRRARTRSPSTARSRFAEWLAVTYGDRGIGVSVLCPMGVATPLLMDPLAAGDPGAQAVAASGEIVTRRARRRRGRRRTAPTSGS